ncbi:hypothetical protein D3C86_1086930 [compost metagenome]
MTRDQGLVEAMAMIAVIRVIHRSEDPRGDELAVARAAQAVEVGVMSEGGDDAVLSLDVAVNVAVGRGRACKDQASGGGGVVPVDVMVTIRQGVVESGRELGGAEDLLLVAVERDGCIVGDPVDLVGIPSGMDVEVSGIRDRHSERLVEALEGADHVADIVVEANITGSLVAADDDVSAHDREAGGVALGDHPIEGAVSIEDEKGAGAGVGLVVGDPDLAVGGDGDVLGLDQPGAGRRIGEEGLGHGVLSRVHGARGIEALEAQEVRIGSEAVAVQDVVDALVGRVGREVGGDGDGFALQTFELSCGSSLKVREIEFVHLAEADAPGVVELPNLPGDIAGDAAQVDLVALQGRAGPEVGVDRVEGLAAGAVRVDPGQLLQGPLDRVEVARVTDQSQRTLQAFRVDGEPLGGAPVDLQHASSVRQDEETVRVRPDGGGGADAEADLPALRAGVDPVDAIADVVRDVDVTR